MNKADFQEWKTNEVTKEFLEHTLAAQQEIRESSCLRDTADQTAMQAARNEGFCEGVAALIIFIEDKMLEAEDED